MSEWRYGRYFLLEDDVNGLFQWLTKNFDDEWKVEVLGLCPTEDKLILNTVFESEENLKYFQDEFIGDESRYSSVYNNRRKPNHEWPVSAERRETGDRRAAIHRRNPKRRDSRRLEDVVKRALIKKKSFSEQPIRVGASQ
jgi:hypothetical protein